MVANSPLRTLDPWWKDGKLNLMSDDDVKGRLISILLTIPSGASRRKQIASSKWTRLLVCAILPNERTLHKRVQIRAGAWLDEVPAEQKITDNKNLTSSRTSAEQEQTTKQVRKTLGAGSTSYRWHWEHGEINRSGRIKACWQDAIVKNECWRAFSSGCP